MKVLSTVLSVLSLLLLTSGTDPTEAELSPEDHTADDAFPEHLSGYRFVAMASSLNVFKQPLKLFSQQPMTGYFRDGYCRTTDSGPGGASGPFTATDPGNHAVAGIVSDEFLDFSASRGNDLRSVGLRGGCRWCLCTSRWLEAHSAFRAGRISEMGVPRVDLEATEDSALAKVDLETLRKFEVKHREVSASGSGGAGGSP